MFRALQKVLGIAAVAVMICSPGVWPVTAVRALSPDSAPALPAPSGSVINVSTVAALQAAVGAVASNQTVVIAPGTYNLTSTLWLNGSKANVTIRGATNNRDDVVLVGQGMGVLSAAVPFGIWTGGGVTGVTIANLTIRDIYQHPIMLNGGTESPRIYNVRLVDAGEQFIKSNPDGAGGGVDNGIVEYSVLEYTNTAPSYYTNGIDVHTGRDWIVRHNLFRRIRAPQGELAGPAVLMWNGSSGSIVEANTFIDCHRDISLGLIERSPNDHTAGIIRNNFIVRNAGSGGDAAIAVFDSPSTKVAHNTIWMNGQYGNAIEVRFAHSTGVSVTNNLSDRPAQNRDGGSSVMSGNVWTAASSWFVSPATGNLHLTASATPAIDHGLSTGDAPVDWDNQARPSGGTPDIGADETGGGTPPPADTTAPTVSLTSPSQGATINGTVTLAATASDNVGVAGVRFMVNGVSVGTEDTAAPYQVSWNTSTVSNGTLGLQALARDAAGNTSTSPTVTVSVNNTIADTTAPTVSLTAPSNGATISGTVLVSASASDNVGVASVQFTLNGVNLGAPDTTSPFAVNWNTTGAANGSHVLRAVARDAAGNQQTSSQRTVTVSNQSSDTTPPTASLSAPTVGVTIGGTTVLAAVASDNVGVAGVRFLVNGVLIGTEDTAAPYQASWNTTTAADGTHWIQVVARDAAGNVRYTPGVGITVNNHPADVTPPVVNLSTPSEGATVAGTVTVAANASDNVGVVAVQFTLDGANIGTPATSSPYAIAWNTASAIDGVHTLRAVGRDAAGNTTTSAARTVTIANAAAPSPSRRDLNGDRRPDLLLQHTTGQLYAWFMTGADRSGGQLLTPSSMDAAWRPVAIDDFSADGRGDVLWQHRTTGGLALWVMQGTLRVIETAVGGSGHSVWRVAATGDVNGDGHADIIWQHPTTGLIKVWLMRYWSVVVETGVTPYRADPAWRLVGAADFNADGRDDILWQHQQTGQLSVWFMGSDGRTAANVQNLASVAATPGWRVIVADDFDGNGSPDIIWHQPQTGQLSVWLLDGLQLMQERALSPAQIDPGWSLATGP